MNAENGRTNLFAYPPPGETHRDANRLVSTRRMKYNRLAETLWVVHACTRVLGELAKAGIAVAGVGRIDKSDVIVGHESWMVIRMAWRPVVTEESRHRRRLLAYVRRCEVPMVGTIARGSFGTEIREQFTEASPFCGLLDCDRRAAHQRTCT